MSCSWVACPKTEICRRKFMRCKCVYVYRGCTEEKIYLDPTTYWYWDQCILNWVIDQVFGRCIRNMCILAEVYVCVREKLRGKINAEKKTANNDFPLYTRSCVPQYLCRRCNRWPMGVFVLLLTAVDGTKWKYENRARVVVGGSRIHTRDTAQQSIQQFAERTVPVC